MSRACTELRAAPRLPFAEAPRGVRVRVRVTPRARAARIGGLREDGEGGVRLEVAVTEAPDAGRANAGLVALLAREWRLPKSALAVVSGAADRHKTISVSGDPGTLMAKLRDWSRERGWVVGE
jgi:uncharacterized protein YggU (UPF0235/DUF167 family)